MKNTFISIIACFSLLLTVISCHREDCRPSEASGSTVLTACLEQQTDTKTNMSGAVEGSDAVSVVWTAGDKISVLSGESYSTNSEFSLAEGDENKSTGSFIGTSVSGDIIAVYPFSPDIAYSAGKVTVNLPQTQIYTSGSFAQNAAPMAAKGTAGSPLHFKYLSSAIAFKVNGSGKTVTKVTVSATTPLWGPAEITGLDDTPALNMTGTDRKYRTVELNCGAEDISSDKVFFIAVPAGTYTFAVNVYCSDRTVFHTKYTEARTFSIARINYNRTAKAFTTNGPAYVDGDYIGDPIPIPAADSTIFWAPVNCGYDTTDFRYGKLYQFGRAVGCGYGNRYGNRYGNSHWGIEDPDAGGVILKAASAGFDTNGHNSMLDSDDFNNYFYYRNDLKTIVDWYGSTSDSQLPSWPMKPTDTGYVEGKIGNPCPTGWRVPTDDEAWTLVGGSAIPTTSPRTHNGLAGYWFDGGKSVASDNSGIFIPASGFRNHWYGVFCFRGMYGYFWTSSGADNYGNYSSTGAYGAFFGYGENNAAGVLGTYRAYGLPVRCVPE